MADFFSKLKKGFDKGVNKVSIKSNTLVEINKVKGEINTLNTNIQQQKNELSNKFYHMYLQDEIDVEACKVFCHNIKEFEAQIREKEKVIEEIKAKEEILLAEANKKVDENKEETAKAENIVEVVDIVEVKNEEVKLALEKTEIIEEAEVIEETEITLDK